MIKQREIKFRAWFKGIGEDKESIHYNCIDFSERENYKVMQFTGLRDKNGKEIYESDLLKHEDGWVVEVGYSSEQPIYIVYPTGEDSNIDIEKADQDWYLGDSHKFEVIGNIYENPNLLK